MKNGWWIRCFDPNWIRCTNCKEEFSILNRRYNDELSDTTVCTKCNFKTSRYNFDFVEEINVNDKVIYAGKDPSLYKEEKGMQGKILGILGAGKNKLGNSLMTTQDDLFAISFDGQDTEGFLCLYHRGLFEIVK